MLNRNIPEFAPPGSVGGNGVAPTRDDRPPSAQDHNKHEGGSDPAAGFTIIDHHTTWYTEVLQAFHANLRPRRYCEIGTLAGETLALADCASVAVDPTFQLAHDVVGKKPSCLLFQMASDAFFANFDLTSLLGGPVDLAFLDGMHWFEFLLRDFMNTERHARRNSIILLHDCLPTDPHVARRNNGDDTLAHRSSRPGWWAGDVWKTVAILKKYRPDLRLHACMAAPTGLIAVTNLDPGATTLSDNYFDIVARFSRLEANRQNILDMMATLDLVAPEAMLTADHLAARFWL